MRDSADSDDYGVFGRGRKRGRFDDADRAYVKRDRHRPGFRPRTPTTPPTACRKATAGPPGKGVTASPRVGRHRAIAFLVGPVGG